MNRLLGTPELGAQIWIEPGQTDGDIDRWMRILADHRMPVARLWILWNLVETAPDTWDFSLYDAAFEAALRHGVAIVATLTPGSGPVFRGYPALVQHDRIPDSLRAYEQALSYVRKVAERYKDHPALDTWLLMNEPGLGPTLDEWAAENFRRWLPSRYPTIEALNAAWCADFQTFEQATHDEALVARQWSYPARMIDWYDFWRDHQTNQLKVWGDTVRSIDPVHPRHINPHGLLSNLAASSNDLPAWRFFLESSGASIHPAWHFWMLKPSQYAMGVAYVCDLMRGAFEPLPIWVSELQGGNNIYTSVRPMCPDARDIAQWVWSGIGSGAKRVIYWLLNSRRASYEGGEWSLLDFQGEPSERIVTSSQIVEVIEENADFFAESKPVEPPIIIGLSLETMTLQMRFSSSDVPARGEYAHVQEALGIYEVLQELGIPVRIKHIHDIAWEDESLASGQMLILPHVWALTPAQSESVAAFVERGNTVLATGMTSFYEPNGKVLALQGLPLARVFGGQLKELCYVGKECFIDFREASVPVHAIMGEIRRESGEILAERKDKVLALRNAYGKGESYWIPSMIGLASWLGVHEPLAALLSSICKPFSTRLPFGFDGHYPYVVLRILQNGSSFVTVLINGANEPVTPRLRHPAGLQPTVIWGNPDGVTAAGMHLGGRESLVVRWT